MAVEKTADVTPGEHPLMSNKTLRAMYTRMVKVRAVLGTTLGKKPGMDDVACWVSSLAGTKEDDVVFGCRKDGALAVARGVAQDSGKDRIIEGGVERLYAAIGAARTVRGSRIVVAFSERHEAEKTGWVEGLRFAVELPLIVVVLPRWKGHESERDLCRETRDAGVPGIPVDGQDAVALYRVAQESIGRARAHGGAAVIEGVRLQKCCERRRMRLKDSESTCCGGALRNKAGLTAVRPAFSAMGDWKQDVSSGEREGTLSGNPMAFSGEVYVRKGLLFSLATLAGCGLPHAFGQTTPAPPPVTTMPAPVNQPASELPSRNAYGDQQQTPAKTAAAEAG